MVLFRYLRLDYRNSKGTFNGRFLRVLKKNSKKTKSKRETDEMGK